MISSMPHARLSKEKRALVLAALCEGTPINAVTRMFNTGKHAVLRVIEESGEALADYMDKNFRDLPVARVAMDEQWQYVGKHGHRMSAKEDDRGDFWLWAAIDSDTKLVFSHRVGRRNFATGNEFVGDVKARVSGPVQIATDNNHSYARMIRGTFGYEGYSYGTETKIFGEPNSKRILNFTPADWSAYRRRAVPKAGKSKRRAVVGAPNLGSCTTSHIERLFLTIRQESTRFTRKTLGYSKDLEMHKLSVALHLGVYNLVRRHSSLGTTPAVAAGVEEKRWSWEDVIALTDAYWQPKLAAQAQEKAATKRAAEDAVFEQAIAALNNSHNA